MKTNLTISLDRISVLAPSIPRFRGCGMRNYSSKKLRLPQTKFWGSGHCVMWTVCTHLHTSMRVVAESSQVVAFL
jgi:hypothetical protein